MPRRDGGALRGQESAASPGLAVGAVAVWGLIASGLVRGTAPIPRFTQLTFRAGTISAARFAPDGETIIYSAAWHDQPYGLYMSRTGSAESRPLGITGAKLLGRLDIGRTGVAAGKPWRPEFLRSRRRHTCPRVACWRRTAGRSRPRDVGGLGAGHGPTRRGPNRRPGRVSDRDEDLQVDRRAESVPCGWHPAATAWR